MKLIIFTKPYVEIYYSVYSYTTFVSRNPTPNQTDELLNVTWQPVRGYLTQHLVIEESLHMETKNLLKERSALWESFWSLSSEEDEIFVAINIIAVILGLAMVSLIYLIYTSSCSKGYLVL